jgi:hypothetical protein
MLFFLIFCAAKALQVNILEGIIKRKLIRGEYWTIYSPIRTKETEQGEK